MLPAFIHACVGLRCSSSWSASVDVDGTPEVHLCAAHLHSEGDCRKWAVLYHYCCDYHIEIDANTLAVSTYAITLRTPLHSTIHQLSFSVRGSLLPQPSPPLSKPCAVVKNLAPSRTTRHGLNQPAPRVRSRLCRSMWPC